MNADSLMKLVPAYEYRHARLWANVRAGTGVWLLVLTAMLYGSGRSAWYGLLLAPAAAVLFLLAFYLPRAIRARTSSTNAG